MLTRWHFAVAYCVDEIGSQSAKRMRLQYLDQFLAPGAGVTISRNVIHEHSGYIITLLLSDSVDAGLDDKTLIDNYASDFAESLLWMKQHIVCGDPHVGLLAQLL